MSTKEEEILAAWEQAKERIKPAILADTLANGQLVNAYMVNHQLPYTEDNFYKAVRAVMRELKWTVKPAQLLVLESADKPTLLENQRTIEQERHEKIKALEQRDKILASNAATEKLIEAAISGYFPTTRLGRPSLPKKESEQARLRAYVQHEIKRNADRKSILEQVNKEIERLYAEEAIVNERL